MSRNRIHIIVGQLFIIAACLLIPFTSVYSQQRTELEKKQAKKEQEIAYTNKMLREISSNSKKSYNELLLLNRKISLRQEFISNIVKEIELINEKINENKVIIESLEADLKRVREEYAKMIYYAYKNKSSTDRMIFILSADDFNQSYKRLRYLQYYSQFRKKQTVLILRTQDDLQKKLDDLNKRKEDKQQLVKAQQEETIIIEMEKAEQGKVLTSLKEKEAELKKQLAEQQAAAVKLQNAIRIIIEEEARKAAERSKKADRPGEFLLTPEEKIISDNFGANIGRLPWPTERGEITATFGEHEHPVIPGIMIRNNGIDISTLKGAVARAMFEGEVRQILDIPGANKAVIIRHGTYLTVYQNLDEVYVKKGQQVKSKDNIGKISTKGADNTTTLHIEIWKENVKQDPAIWLTGR